VPVGFTEAKVIRKFGVDGMPIAPFRGVQSQ
jgi:hypothetical protein